MSPSSQRLWAANGTEIEIVGEVTVRLLLDGRCYTTALVSPDVEEVMLGSDLLQAHNCLWDLGRGRFFVDGRAAVTLSRKRPLCCRRVFVQDEEPSSTEVPLNSCEPEASRNRA